jgi:hypothetical protein
MNSNISVESHTISMEQQSVHSNLSQENLEKIQSQSEHTTRPQIQLPTSQTGENELNQISIHSGQISTHKNEKNFANQSLNLKSNVKPKQLLEKPPEIRILKVSKDDIKALNQVIYEFQEQFS